MTPASKGLSHSSISANINTGFEVTTQTGQPARLAIIDEQGNIIEAGADVAAELWRICITVQKNFWEGQGHLKVLSQPAKTKTTSKKKAA